MTRDEFWKLIDATRVDEPQAHADAIVERLVEESLDDVLEFGRHFEEVVRAGYSWELWGAAYLINGGCSDDGFEYFRRWLVLQGKKVYDAALKNPESLAKLGLEEEVEFEGNPAYEAYKRITDQDDFYEAVEKRFGPLTKTPNLGEGWDFDKDKEMKKRYPKLFKQFGG